MRTSRLAVYTLIRNAYLDWPCKTPEALGGAERHRGRSAAHQAAAGAARRRHDGARIPILQGISGRWSAALLQFADKRRSGALPAPILARPASRPEMGHRSHPSARLWSRTGRGAARGASPLRQRACVCVRVRGRRGGRRARCRSASRAGPRRRTRTWPSSTAGGVSEIRSSRSYRNACWPC